MIKAFFGKIFSLFIGNLRNDQKFLFWQKFRRKQTTSRLKFYDAICLSFICLSSSPSVSFTMYSENFSGEFSTRNFWKSFLTTSEALFVLKTRTFVTDPCVGVNIEVCRIRHEVVSFTGKAFISCYFPFISLRLDHSAQAAAHIYTLIFSNFKLVK